MCLLCQCLEIDGRLTHNSAEKATVRELKDEAKQVYSSMTPPAQEYCAAQKPDDPKPYKSAS